MSHFAALERHNKPPSRDSKVAPTDRVVSIAAFGRCSELAKLLWSHRPTQFRAFKTGPTNAASVIIVMAQHEDARPNSRSLLHASVDNTGVNRNWIRRAYLETVSLADESGE